MNLFVMQVMVSIETDLITHSVASVKVMLITEASVPKLSPEIVIRSPPRKLICVLGEIDDVDTGTDNSVVIEFGIRPLGLETTTIQFPLTALVSRSQVISEAVLVTTLHCTGPNLITNSSVVGRLVPVIVNVVPLSD